MVSSWRSRENEAKDDWFDGVGCGAVKVRPNYPSLDIIFLLAYRGILVFYFTINRTPRVGGDTSIQPSLSHPLAMVTFSEIWVCFIVYVRKGEKVRYPSNPPKSGRMLWWFSHLVNV
jgi:hypothetical protein